MKRRLIVFIMSVLLIISTIVPVQARGLEKQDIYDASLEELECYLNGMESAPLEDLFMNFSELGRFEMSAELAVYTDVLCNLERDEYGRIFLYLDVLKMNTEFCQFLEESAYLGTIEELENYARGRQAEANGDSEAAAGYYSQCMSFMDSMTRILNYRSNNMEEQYLLACGYYKQDTLEGYEQAYAIFSELAVYNYNNSAAMMDMSAWFIKALSQATPEVTGTLTPVPTPAPTETLVAKVTPTPTAESKAWGDWSNWSIQKVTEDSTTQVESKIQYRSRSIAQKPVYTDWSNWSGWSISAPSASDVVEVKHQVQYRYRDQITTYSDWSAWGSWTRTRKTFTDNSVMKEESAMRSFWWAAKCNSCGRHNPYWGSSTKCVSCGKYLPKGSYSNASYYSDDTTGSTLDGRAIGRTYDGKRYWYAGDDRKVMMYRYSTRTLSYGWGAWSDWSATAVSESSTRQVEARTVYSTRTREQETKFEYGTWSGWDDKYVKETTILDVEVRTVYRYRKYQ